MKESPMRVLTLNLRHNANRWDERLPLVAQLLNAESPDIIALQEVWLPIQQAHLIASHLDNHYTIYIASKSGDEQGREGIALLSRHPVRQREMLHLPEGNRVAQRFVVQINGRDVVIANTHLHHRPMHDETIRLPQMRVLIDWLRPFDLPVILTGDMNALPDSDTIQYAKISLKSAFETKHGSEPDTTFPTPLTAADYPAGLKITLDYILYTSQTLHIKSARLTAHRPAAGDAKLYPSDHYGLIADVELQS